MSCITIESQTAIEFDVAVNQIDVVDTRSSELTQNEVSEFDAELRRLLAAWRDYHDLPLNVSIPLRVELRQRLDQARSAIRNP